LLVLPFRRDALAAGTVAGVVPVSVLQLVAAVALIVLATSLPLSGLNQSFGDVAWMLVVALPPAFLLGVLAAAIGCLAGVIGAGSEDAVSIGDLLGVPFVGVAAAFFLAPEAVTGPIAWLAPIVGPVTAIRDGITGALEPVEAVAVTLSSVVWIGLVVWLAATRIADERRVLRAG
jgi:ABC-type Na+ efflux pump permease subunit